MIIDLKRSFSLFRESSSLLHIVSHRPIPPGKVTRIENAKKVPVRNINNDELMVLQ